MEWTPGGPSVTVKPVAEYFIGASLLLTPILRTGKPRLAEERLLVRVA